MYILYEFEIHLAMCWINKKIVLKTHLFGKIFPFLCISFISSIKSKETLNKNQLQKKLQLQNNWNFKVLKSIFYKNNKLKIVYKIISVQK